MRYGCYKIAVMYNINNKITGLKFQYVKTLYIQDADNKCPFQVLEAKVPNCIDVSSVAPVIHTED